MADPLTIASDLVTKILSQVGNVKTHHKQCALLGSLAEQALRVLTKLPPKDLSNPSVASTTELVHEALNEANEAVESCSNASFFSTLLRPENYSMRLGHAADKLKHALSLLPSPSTSTVADIKVELDALHDQLRHANFDKRAAMAHQTISLREELDKAFHQQAQESEEIKELIRELMQEQFSSQEKLKKELATLRRNANEARLAKERLQEYELNQIIAVVAESLGEVNEEPTPIQDIRESLCCPISKEIMRDPVTLKDSGMTYDRSSITEWFERGHRYDPLTNVELISKEIVQCHALRRVCHLLLDKCGNTSSLNEDVDEDEHKPSLSPGLYEGHGRLHIGSSTIYMYQLLFLQPNAVAKSCTMYGTDNEALQTNSLEIGGGQWDCHTLQLSFGDQQYSFNGYIYLGVACQQSRIVCKGTASKHEGLEKEYNFIFVYDPSPIKHRSWMHPRILQMHCETIKAQDNVEYTITIVLCLELDFTVSGWMWFRSCQTQSIKWARVSLGKWALNGALKFSVYFPQNNIPLDSYMEPLNEQAAFRIDGCIGSSRRHSPPTFISSVWKISDDDTVRDKRFLSTPLDHVKRLKCPLVQTISLPWHNLHQNPLGFLQESSSMPSIEMLSSHYMDSDCLLELSDNSIKANYDIRYGLISRCQSAFGRSPLHIASMNNLTSIVKELIASGANINFQDKRGETPLHIASKRGLVSIVHTLLGNGASKEITNNEGKTPYNIACADVCFAPFEKAIVEELNDLLKT